MATQQEIDQVYRTTLIITGSLVAGQLLFAAISWFLHNNGSRTPSGQPLLNPLTFAWIFIALSGFGAGLFLRQRLSALSESHKGQELMRSGIYTLAQVHGQVVIIFSLVEAAGLLGLVNYFLTGHTQLLIATLAFLAFATAVFFPRREWFDAFRQA